MNKVTIFKYEESKLVRTMNVSGEPWFVLKDVCDVLGLSTPARVAERLDSDEVSQAHLIDSMGRSQEMTIISESGLYNVILRSDKPEAKPFRKWVTAVVLPSIRKNGGYIAGQEELSPQELMLAFESFLNSPFVTQWCHQHDIAIVVPTAVQDLTDLVHDTNYEFRAMLEIAVYFTMTAIGITGTLDIDSVKHSDGEDDIQADDVINIEPQVTPTPSGGGSSEMTAHEGEYFTNAEINNRLAKEEKDI